jgi:hypothetical protein
MMLKEMMPENLLETWSKLAPNECILTDINKLTYDLGGELACSPLLTDPHDKWKIQGYIQECIEARGWGWDIGNYFGLKSISSGSEIWVSAEKKITIEGQYRIPPFRSLLAAYLTAIADQRPITQGPWKHADGDIYWVTDAHKWSGHGFYSFLNEDWLYLLEEHPNIKIQMLSNNYNASQDYGDRVFCDGDSGKWARLKDSFLGLKDDGRLRFEKVDD